MNYASSPSTHLNYLQAFGTGSQGNSFLIQKEPSLTTIKQEYGGLTNVQGLRKIANPADIEATLTRNNFSSGTIATQATLQQKSNQDKVRILCQIFIFSLPNNLPKVPTNWPKLLQSKTRKKAAGVLTNSSRFPLGSNIMSKMRLATHLAKILATKIRSSSFPTGQ